MTPDQVRILVVNDESAIRDTLVPGIDGVEVMRHVKSRAGDTVVLLITAYASLETSIDAVREGASDYLTKPVRFESLILKIRNLLRIRDLEWENRIFRIERPPIATLHEIIGNSEAIRAMKRSVEQVGPTMGNVLIEGESGTGKELVARAIHAANPEARGAFVPVNCGSIPDTLLESEFFRYRRGAFTGADQDKDGLFQEARNGPLYLDEVAELPLSLQPKILRAIELKEVRPLGTNRPVPVDVRVVTATNLRLEEMVAAKKFREDLFFRINVFRISVPALRERMDDIPILAEHFLTRFRGEIRSPVREISADAMAVLQIYPWKGNVRELQNVIQRALITVTRPVIGAGVFERILAIRSPRARDLKTALREFEFHRCGGDKRVAAERLGISLASLYAKIKD